MITKLLNKSTIQLQMQAENWEQAGQIAGNILLRNKSVTEDYIDRMLDAVHEYGPYIVIAPGIALFHARPESSVKEICLSMVTLKDPVIFNAGENDPVDLVFALGAVDHDSHLKSMAQLMTILQDKHLLEKIRKEHSVDEVVSLIQAKLEMEDKNDL